MVDIQFQGPKFTWIRGLTGSRMDRYVANSDWFECFHAASSLHLPKLKSDHCPILLKLSSTKPTAPTKRPFKFFAPWVTHEGFTKRVKDNWKVNHIWEENVNLFTNAVQKWNRNVFGDINNRKADLLAQLDQLNNYDNQAWDQKRQEVWKELEKCLIQEEIMWMQRSRCNWYSYGDKNTRYFHTSTQCRRERKNIKALQKGDGNGATIRRSLN